MPPSDALSDRQTRSSSAHRRALVENEIYEHATRLFAEKGFASTTLQDIADALGMTRPAVYYYFKTKEEILARLVGQITQAAATELDEVAARDDLSPPEKLREIARRHITRISGQADQFRLLLKSESELPEDIAVAQRAARRDVLAAFVQVVQAGVDRGQFRSVDARTGALGVIGLCNWVAWWVRPGDDAATVVDTLTEMAVASLRPPGSSAREPGTDGALAHLRDAVDHLERSVATERRRRT